MTTQFNIQCIERQSVPCEFENRPSDGEREIACHHVLPRQSQLDFDSVVRLSGGLGNQLFQYAFAMNLESVFSKKVAFDTTFYDQPQNVMHNRLRLPDYGFDLPTVTNQLENVSLARKFKKLPDFVQQALFRVTFKKCSLHHSPVQVKPGLTYFTGLWQSPQYFEAIKELVRETFRVRLLGSNDIHSQQRLGVVGFHVRRGDYLTHKQSFDLDYATYLSVAIARLEAITGNSKLRVSVFSDDPDWCARHLTGARIEINRGGEMMSDFQGLLNCQHKIISNSTFAWWAAFLGETDRSIVLAPGRWHSKASNEQAKILPDNWMIVEQ